MSISDPLGPDPGRRVYSPVLCFLIEHPAGNVLFDTGLHADWCGVHELGQMAIELAAEEHVVSRLAAIGFSPADVAVVVLSHLHADHAGSVEHFPHAEVLVQRAERDFAARRPVYQDQLFDHRDFHVPPRWREIEGELDLHGDGAVTLLPTPGHTPGHQSALISLPGGPVVLAGDVSYHLEPMRARRLSAVVWSADAAVDSWERLERLERERGARLLLSHDVTFRETIRLSPDLYYE